MNYHREYEIAWQGLKIGRNVLGFEVDDMIFSEMGFLHPDFEKLKADVTLSFDKESNFFFLHFDVNGQANVRCDRCGDWFPMKLWDEYELIIKLTDSTQRAEAMNNEEDDAEVVFLSRKETVINVFEWIYEAIMLSIPIQKVHPDLPDGQSGCNPETLKLLDKMRQSPEERKVNSIWKDLEQFKNKSLDN